MDGSKTTDGVGSEFIVHYRNERIHKESITLPNTATVFQTEVEAIYIASQFLLVNPYNQKIKQDSSQIHEQQY